MTEYGYDESWSSKFDPDLRDYPDISPVQLPHLWQETKRLILKGNVPYQNVGLSILAQFSSHFPLNEATDVLERYFEQNDYIPSNSMRGGINIEPLKATYSVATAFDFGSNLDPSEAQRRQHRMLALLNKVVETAKTRHSTDEMIMGDLNVARETYHAILTERSGYDPKYQYPGISATREDKDLETKQANEEFVITETGQDQSFQAPSQSDIEVTVLRMFEQHKKEVAPSSLSAMDVISSKYEIVNVRQEVASLKEVITVRFESMGNTIDSVNKTIDRHMAGQQVKMAGQQVKWAIIGAVIAIIAVIVSVLLGARIPAP